MSEPESVDALLNRIEAITARLAQSAEPIDQLALAYEEGLKLVAAAGERLTLLQSGGSTRS